VEQIGLAAAFAAFPEAHLEKELVVGVVDQEHSVRLLDLLHVKATVEFLVENLVEAPFVVDLEERSD
jgi:hypothetical protein